MKSAFYPGAGMDIVPPILFRSIRHWIYMDSQPRSEFGDDYREGLSRPQFITELITIMNQNGFELRATENDVFTFYHSLYEQTIRYETNSVFPDALKRNHRECDTLVLCGYSLENRPCNFIDSYPNIITNSHTIYDNLDEKIILTKHVFTMMYNKNWKYWEPSNLTTSEIQRYVAIANQYIPYRYCDFDFDFIVRTI